MRDTGDRIARDQRCEGIVDGLRDYLGARGTRVLERLHVVAQWASEDVVDAGREGYGGRRDGASAAMTRLRDLLAIIEERTEYHQNHPDEPD